MKFILPAALLAIMSCKGTLAAPSAEEPNLDKRETGIWLDVYWDGACKKWDSYHSGYIWNNGGNRDFHCKNIDESHYAARPSYDNYMYTLGCTVKAWELPNCRGKANVFKLDNWKKGSPGGVGDWDFHCMALADKRATWSAGGSTYIPGGAKSLSFSC